MDDAMNQKLSCRISCKGMKMLIGRYYYNPMNNTKSYLAHETIYFYFLP